MEPVKRPTKKVPVELTQTYVTQGYVTADIDAPDEAVERDVALAGSLVFDEGKRQYGPTMAARVIPEQTLIDAGIHKNFDANQLFGAWVCVRFYSIQFGIDVLAILGVAGTNADPDKAAKVIVGDILRVDRNEHAVYYILKHDSVRITFDELMDRPGLIHIITNNGDMRPRMDTTLCGIPVELVKESRDAINGVFRMAYATNGLTEEMLYSTLDVVLRVPVNTADRNYGAWRFIHRQMYKHYICSEKEFVPNDEVAQADVPEEESNPCETQVALPDSLEGSLYARSLDAGNSEFYKMKDPNMQIQENDDSDAKVRILYNHNETGTIFLQEFAVKKKNLRNCSDPENMLRLLGIIAVEHLDNQKFSQIGAIIQPTEPASDNTNAISYMTAEVLCPCFDEGDNFPNIDVFRATVRNLVAGGSLYVERPIYSRKLPQCVKVVQGYAISKRRSSQDELLHSICAIWAFDGHRGQIINRKNFGRVIAMNDMRLNIHADMTIQIGLNADVKHRYMFTFKYRLPHELDNNTSAPRIADITIDYTINEEDWPSEQELAQMERTCQKALDDYWAGVAIRNRSADTRPPVISEAMAVANVPIEPVEY